MKRIIIEFEKDNLIGERVGLTNIATGKLVRLLTLSLLNKSVYFFSKYGALID